MENFTAGGRYYIIYLTKHAHNSFCLCIWTTYSINLQNMLKQIMYDVVSANIHSKCF